MYEFAHPEYLWALLLIPFAWVLFMFYSWWRKNSIKRFGDFSAFNKLAPRQSGWRRFIKFSLITLSLASVVIALSNPRVGTSVEKINRRGLDLVFVVDVSLSMLTEDITPSRILNAKNIISKSLEKLGSDRVGIIAYAGEAYPMLPMTIDYNAASLALKGLEPEDFPSQGTRIERALEMADEYFPEEQQHSQILVVISDGEDHGSQWKESIQPLLDKGIQVFTIGVGTEKGGPIPLYYGGRLQGYKKDNQGEVVISKLESETLRELAKVGGGEYFLGNSVYRVTDELLDELLGLNKKEIDARTITNYEDQFPWFLGMALFFLLLEMAIHPRANVWLEKWGWVKQKTDDEV